jgi:hypothetical protein
MMRTKMSKTIEIERGIFTFIPGINHVLKRLSEVHLLYIVFYERVVLLNSFSIAPHTDLSKAPLNVAMDTCFSIGLHCVKKVSRMCNRVLLVQKPVVSGL